MHGKIYFNDLESFVEFLKAFSGKTTATFEARQTKQNESGEWVIEFQGGY